MDIEENRHGGAEKWIPVYVSMTSNAVRYVKAEDSWDAEEAFSELYKADGAFAAAVKEELRNTDSISVEWDAEEDPSLREADIDPSMTVSDKAGAKSLAEWRREASLSTNEMRFGDIVAKRWGSAETGYQGLRIGFYDVEGDFSVVAIVEVDRMNDGAEEQVKVLVWNDDVDSDPDVQVDWLGPEPGEGRALEADRQDRPAQNRAEAAQDARDMLASALAAGDGLYNVATGYTIMPDANDEGLLHGFQTARTDLGILYGNGEGGFPKDPFDYAFENYPAPGALGGMVWVPEYVDELYIDRQDPMRTIRESSSCKQVISMLAEHEPQGWCLANPESVHAKAVELGLAPIA